MKNEGKNERANNEEQKTEDINDGPEYSCALPIEIVGHISETATTLALSSLRLVNKFFKLGTEHEFIKRKNLFDSYKMEDLEKLFMDMKLPEHSKVEKESEDHENPNSKTWRCVVC